MGMLWWITLIVSVLVYLLLVQFFLPSRFFKSRYATASLLDRGIANYKEKDGRSIVYEPKHEYKQYIDQYILSQRNKKTLILCKIAQNISFLDYDIVLLNARNRIFKVINVKDSIENIGYTKEIELPTKTAYANLHVNSVNGVDVFSHINEKPTFNLRASIYAAVILLISILEVFVVRTCVALIYGDVFWQDFSLVTVVNLNTALLGVALAAVNLALLSVHFRLRKSNAQVNQF